MNTVQNRREEYIIFSDLFHPGIFVLNNEWIPHFRNKLHLQRAGKRLVYKIPPQRFKNWYRVWCSIFKT